MLEDYRDFRNELEHHEKQLQEEKEALEKALAEKDLEIIQLGDARKQLSETKTLLEKHLEAKERELVILDEFTSSLQDDKNALDTQLVQAHADLAELKEAHAKLAGEKATQELELKEKIEAVAKLGVEKASLETSLADTSEALKIVTEEKDMLAEEKLTLEHLVTERNTELEGLNKERITLAEENDVFNTKLSETEKKLAVLDEARAKVEANLSNANGKIGELTRRIEEEAAKTDEKEKEMSLLKATMEKRDAEYGVAKEDLVKMTEKMQELETRGIGLEAQLKAMTATVKEKAGLAETLDAELGDLTKKMGEAVTRINTLEAELKETADKAEERRTRIEHLESQLSILISSNTQLQHDLSTAQTTLTTTLQDLSTKTSRLSELDSLRVPLTDESEDTYVTILDSIWTRIASLIESTFRQDLSPATLSDESCWTNLLQSPYTRHIPLPRTNTPAAKQMRIAVTLSLLSRSLHTHIFRPSYLTATSHPEDPLPQILHTIALANPSHEEHTRATLLAMLPAEKQRTFGAKRVGAVVREVSYAVQHLLTALQYEAFCTGLEQVCKLACAQWMRIQLGKMRVEPYFGPPFGEFDWQVLPLPVFEGGGERDDLVVEVGRPVEDGRVGGHGEGAVREDAEVGPDDIMLVVWPSMCIVENGELESITQGLVISKDQVRAATDEVRGRGRQRPGAKRARTLSMPGRGVSGQAFLPRAGEVDLVDG